MQARQRVALKAGRLPLMLTVCALQVGIHLQAGLAPTVISQTGATQTALQVILEEVASVADQSSRAAEPHVRHPAVCPVLLLPQSADHHFEPLCLLPHRP